MAARTPSRAVVACVGAGAGRPQRFVRALALAVRTGAARPGFGRTLLESPVADGIEGVTAWLAEVAQSALDLVLFVDEVERLPEASREVLVYLLRNAPPNLRVVLAARSDCPLASTTWSITASARWSASDAAAAAGGDAGAGAARSASAWTMRPRSCTT